MTTELEVDDFATLQREGVIPMPPKELDEADMERLATEGIGFTVSRVTDENTPDYGIRYSLFCHNETEGFFILRFWANPVRDPVVLGLMGVTKTTAVRNVYLRSVKRGKMTMYLPAGRE